MKNGCTRLVMSQRELISYAASLVTGEEALLLGEDRQIDLLPGLTPSQAIAVCREINCFDCQAWVVEQPGSQNRFWVSEAGSFRVVVRRPLPVNEYAGSPELRAAAVGVKGMAGWKFRYCCYLDHVYERLSRRGRQRRSREGIG